MTKLIFLLLFTQHLHAADMGQQVLGADMDNKFEEEIKEFSNGSVFIQGSSAEDESLNSKRKESSVFLLEERDEENFNAKGKSRFMNSNIKPIGAEEHLESVVTINNKGMLKDLHNQGSKAYSFSYVKDDYIYTKSNSNADNIFNGKTGTHYGTFHFGYQSFFSGETFKFLWGMNVGMGYATGKGDFIDGIQSEVDFKYYRVPVDLSLGFYLSLGRFLGVKVLGGPSVLGIFQNRSDGGGSSGKRDSRQIGFGYFGEGRLSLKLSQMSGDLGFRMFSDYGVSDFNLDLLIRHENYSKYAQDNLSSSGSSIGAGFTFDYL